jgi:hypothetical protein
MAVARQFPSLKLFFAERMSDEDTYIYNVSEEEENRTRNSQQKLEV